MGKRREGSETGHDGLGESDYDRLVRTKEHHRCQWNGHGGQCDKAAVFLTLALATKIKQLPGGPHASVLKGGFCAEHNRAASGSATSVDNGLRGGKNWRDVLVDTALRDRGL